MLRQAGRLPGLPRPPHHQRKQCRVKRLHQVIERAEPHGLDRALDFSLRCHDHHPGPLLRETRAQQVRAQAVGQMDVQQDKVKLHVRQQPLRAAERVGAGDIGAQRLQVGAQAPSQHRLVIHHQHAQTRQGILRVIAHIQTLLITQNPYGFVTSRMSMIS